MSQPYVGEIRMFGGNFAPQGWMTCSGQLLSISQNPVLFTLIGTTYGGDGETSFALPDLQGRFPVHLVGNTFQIGDRQGVESVTLNTQQIPSHTHIPSTSSATGVSDNPSNNFWAKSTTGKPYVNVAGGSPGTLNTATVLSNGGNQSHDNMHPFLCLTFIISLFGIFPTQN